jgi:hypothetical protein
MPRNTLHDAFKARRATELRAEGAAAHDAGVPMAANPHADAADRAQWQRGWIDASLGVASVVSSETAVDLLGEMLAAGAIPAEFVDRARKILRRR